jgi:hypothetical protein
MPMAKMGAPFLSTLTSFVLPRGQINYQIKDFILIPGAFARIAQSGIEFLLDVAATSSTTPRFVCGVHSCVPVDLFPSYLLYNNFFLLAVRRVGKIFLKGVQFIFRKIVKSNYVYYV